MGEEASDDEESYERVFIPHGRITFDGGDIEYPETELVRCHRRRVMHARVTSTVVGWLVSRCTSRFFILVKGLPGKYHREGGEAVKIPLSHGQTLCLSHTRGALAA